MLIYILGAYRHLFGGCAKEKKKVVFWTSLHWRNGERSL